MDKSRIYDLMSNIQIMKPSKIDEDNVKHLAKLEGILQSSEYAAEEKYDGCNYFMSSGLFFSKDHVEKTDNFPHLRDFFIGLNMPNLMFDGEIWYPGRTSQYCTHVTGADPSTAVTFQKQNGPIHYILLDMLRTPKGTWLMKEPYRNRRKLLEYFYNTFVKGTAMEEYIHLTKVNYDDKERFKEDILSNGGEGIVLKKLDSLYVMGKKPMWVWIKIKQKDEADLVITGFDPPTKEYTGTDYDSWPYWRSENGIMVPVTKYYYNNWIGAIRLSAYVDGQLTQICTTSGISEDLRKDMSENPNKYLNRVARIGYMERTDAGIPRHPKFLDMHPDKEARECIWNFNGDE